MLVFFHGLNRGGTCWNPVRVRLGGRACVTPDHPGHGAAPRQESYRVMDYLPAARRHARQHSGAVLFGHSLGAMLALAAAAEEPAHVRGIILEDPPFQTMGTRLPGTELHTYFSALRPFAGHTLALPAAVRALGAAEFGLPGARRTIGQVRDASALRLMAAFLRNVDGRALDAVMDGRWLDGYEERALMARVQCPVLLLQADAAAGGMLTDDDASALAAGGADVTLVKLAGVGHQAHWQATGQVMHHAEAFLAGLD